MMLGGAGTRPVGGGGGGGGDGGGDGDGEMLPEAYAPAFIAIPGEPDCNCIFEGGDTYCGFA